MTAAENSNQVDIGLISDEPEVIAFCNSICSDYGFSIKQWSALEAFIEETSDCRFVLASPKNFESKEAVAELAQGIRFICPEAFVVCATPGTLAKDSAQLAKKSGANMILLKEELMGTSKLEFAIFQALKSSYLPIKATDLVPNQVIPFDVFHLLPQRSKYLKMLFAGDVMDDKKYKKCLEIGEVYVHRSGSQAFGKFILSRNDSSADGLARRCRSQYLSLCGTYSELIVLLTDQTANVSLGEGKEFLRTCTDLCANLIGTLAEFGDASKVINNSAIGELGSVERAPAIAAYVGLFGLQAGLDHIEEIMLAALLADLGLILLPSAIIKKIRDDRLDLLTAQERKLYESHPNLSLNIVLSRKLSVDATMRNIIVSTHERSDGKGFPNALHGDKIPLGAQLIKFCRIYDQKTQVKFGQPRPDLHRIREEIFADDAKAFTQYTAKFWKLIKPSPAEG